MGVPYFYLRIDKIQIFQALNKAENPTHRQQLTREGDIGYFGHADITANTLYLNGTEPHLKYRMVVNTRMNPNRLKILLDKLKLIQGDY